MKGLICFFSCLPGFLGFSQAKHYTIQNISMNDDKPHFGLSVYQNDKALFTSYLLNKNGKVKTFLDNGILTLYTGTKEVNGEIVNIEALQIDKKEDIFNITSATFSPDGKKLYVTTNYTNRKNKPKGDFKETNFHIEVAEYKKGVGWTNFKVLPFCKPRYSYAHPVMSPDGKTLYFTSNLRGGKETTKGPSDIFKVDVLGNNTYGEPRNLGSKVNSYSGEMFPFISKDNTLYFASNRPNGYGGYDIYKCSTNSKGIFEKAIKLPKPINSDKDDICFIIDSENKSGYFSSKRSKGKGEDDIYYFIKN